MNKHHHISPIATIILTLNLFCLNPYSLPAQTTAAADSASPWISNFKDAKEIATAEKKDIALLFTASGWLDLAHTFDKEILNQKEFLDSATQHYTLLRLNIPNEANSQPKELTIQNQLLMQAYRIKGLPTLVLTDSLGRPYAITGYHKDGLSSWVEEFNTLRETREKRDRLFTEAKKLSGTERAKLLAQALPELPGNLAARFYRNIINEIIELDPDNQTGRIGQYKLLIADVNYVDQMQKFAMEGADEKMLKLSDQYLKEAALEGVSKQTVLLHKVGVYEKQKRKDEMIKTLNEIIATDPDSSEGQQAAQLLKEKGSKSE